MFIYLILMNSKMLRNFFIKFKQNFYFSKIGSFFFSNSDESKIFLKVSN